MVHFITYARKLDKVNDKTCAGTKNKPMLMCRIISTSDTNVTNFIQNPIIVVLCTGSTVKY